MPRRYGYPRRRRRTSPELRRYRSALMRPSVQIGILAVTALIVFLLLQSGGR
ncbi:MAG: hypothetical protein ACOYYI_08220 [Chloroflexota bacterium]